MSIILEKVQRWQYTDLFTFRFVSLLCLRSTLRIMADRHLHGKTPIKEDLQNTKGRIKLNNRKSYQIVVTDYHLKKGSKYYY